MSLKHWLPLFLCAALGACNMATSNEPLFADAQRSSALFLQDGLWTHEDPECSVDVSKPKTDWPKCAGWIIVKDSKIVAGSEMKPDEGAQDVFMVDGKPPLIQALVKVNGGESKSFYGYLVLRPMDRSAAGRITRLEIWPVPCGTTKASGDVSPYPGFDKDCRTKSIKALRSAASKPMSAEITPIPLKWVRAGAE